MSFSSDNSGVGNQLPQSIEIPQDYKDFRKQFNDLYQRITASLNSKEGGLYTPNEKLTNQQYFDENDPQNNKSVYRMVVDFGALPNAGTKNVAHNIPWDSSYRLTRAYGGATTANGDRSLSIPNDGICLEINSTNVSIITTTDRSEYTETTVVLEYTKAI